MRFLAYVFENEAAWLSGAMYSIKFANSINLRDLVMPRSPVFALGKFAVFAEERPF